MTIVIKSIFERKKRRAVFVFRKNKQTNKIREGKNLEDNECRLSR